MPSRGAAWLLAWLLALPGCAGWQPYEPPNHREEGSEKGLFTGAQGEVRVAPGALPPDREERKEPGGASAAGE